jgi:hypothetical protein
MDKLYLLFAGITLVFLVSVLAMNISDLYYMRKYEISGFADVSMSANEKNIRACMDSLALYVKPDGTPAEEGKHLCEVFKGVRDAMMEKEDNDGVKDKTVASGNVEKKLAESIPGGALPCPLFTYPVAGSNDTVWLSWFQNIPTDFGARVVFMVIHADANITPQKEVAANVTSPDKIAEIEKNTEKKAEGFEDICTAELIDMKTRMKKAISCVMPSNITPEQIKKTIDEIIIQLKSNRDKILKDTITPVAPQLNSAGSSKMENAISADILGDSNKLFEELKRRIDRTKDALDYLNNKKKEVEDLAGSVSSSIPATAAT